LRQGREDPERSAVSTVGIDCALDAHRIQCAGRGRVELPEDQPSRPGAALLCARRQALHQGDPHRRTRPGNAREVVVDSAAPLVFIALAFLFAGFVKGAIGIGLPTVVMGLLSIVMPPAQAAGLMVLPAMGTNIWQMAAGPSLGKLARRFAGMIVGVFVGTFATIGLLTQSA